MVRVEMTWFYQWTWGQTIEFSQSEQWRGSRLKKKARTMGTYRTVMKDPTLVSSEFPKEKRKGGWKTTWKNNWKLLKFGESSNHTNWRSWVNSKEDKPKDIHANTHHVKHLKIKDKVLKTAWKKWHQIDSEFDQEGQKRSGTIFFKCGKKRTIDHKFYIGQNYPSGTKGK